MRYWHPVGAKTTATHFMLHPENERQQSINSFCSCIFVNQGIVWIREHITELLPALIGKNTIYQRKNTDSKLIDIASHKTSKNIQKHPLGCRLRDFNNTLLSNCKTRALYESRDGPAWRPADNLPKSDGSGDCRSVFSELMVWVYCQPRPPTWQ